MIEYKVHWAKDGLLFFLPMEQAKIAILQLRKQGFKLGNGDCGYGLYSSTWDRQIAEADNIKINDKYVDGYSFNPSILIYLKGFIK